MAHRRCHRLRRLHRERAVLGGRGGESRHGRTPSEVDLPATVDKVRRAVSQAHGVALGGVYLLRPRTIAKTTSGKVGRSDPSPLSLVRARRVTREAVA